MSKTAQKTKYLQYKSSHWEAIQTGVIVEKEVSLTVNGDVWLSFMCTPADLEALAVGFLYNEGILHSAKDLASVRVCQTLDNVDIWLNYPVEEPAGWRRTSGCTGGVTAVDTKSAEPIHKNGLLLSPGLIQNLVIKLFESQELYRQVGGVHTSALTDGETILIMAEDIGRHNTLDKIAGRCLMDDVDPTGKMILTTGRISSEMLQKAAHMGISVLISRTSPTSLSIQVAERLGVTLICYARRDSFRVYTHPERIMPVVGEQSVSTIPYHNESHFFESEDAKQ